MFMQSSALSLVPSNDHDPVPAELRAVIELFSNELAKIAFPDVDAASLKRQAEELRTEAKAVVRAREALEVAAAALATHVAALTQTATRAIAYARIYAEAHPERTALATALAALETSWSPQPSEVAPGKRRGRPRRQSADLFAAPAEPDPT